MTSLCIFIQIASRFYKQYFSQFSMPSLHPYLMKKDRGPNILWTKVEKKKIIKRKQKNVPWRRFLYLNEHDPPLIGLARCRPQVTSLKDTDKANQPWATTGTSLPFFDISWCCKGKNRRRVGVCNSNDWRGYVFPCTFRSQPVTSLEKVRKRTKPLIYRQLHRS